MRNSLKEHRRWRKTRRRKKEGRKERREEEKEEGKREDCEEVFTIGLTFKNQSM